MAQGSFRYINGQAWEVDRISGELLERPEDAIRRLELENAELRAELFRLEALLNPTGEECPNCKGAGSHEFVGPAENGERRARRICSLCDGAGRVIPPVDALGGVDGWEKVKATVRAEVAGVGS